MLIKNQNNEEEFLSPVIGVTYVKSFASKSQNNPNKILPNPNTLNNSKLFNQFFFNIYGAKSYKEAHLTVISSYFFIIFIIFIFYYIYFLIFFIYFLFIFYLFFIFLIFFYIFFKKKKKKKRGRSNFGT